MNFEEYASQSEYYFSESTQEMLPLSQMAYPHLYNAFMRLVSEWDDEFFGTPLYMRMYSLLCPSAASLADVLLQQGKASCMDNAYSKDPVKTARRRLYEAGKLLGKKVRTHHNGKWVEGEIVIEPMRVSVRGREVVHG